MWVWIIIVGFLVMGITAHFQERISALEDKVEELEDRCSELEKNPNDTFEDPFGSGIL